MKHPMQPIYETKDGVLMFKENPIIRHLTYSAKRQNDLHGELFRVGFSDEDWQQYAQLRGYTLEDYGRMGYVSDAAYAEAVNSAGREPTRAGTFTEKDARIARLEHELYALKEALREQAKSLSTLAGVGELRKVKVSIKSQPVEET